RRWAACARRAGRSRPARCGSAGVGPPVRRPEADDSDAATEKLNARGQGDPGEPGDNGDNSRPRRRGGGGLSAQDLLRREGRL
ncbi:hypothetical protein, partial [Mycobacterium sp. SP-6446]|uniref:hypothetical protein n=1 Tax=Mycobacterium sp. SP-6446 TaxID=1834162 RepID=UPI0011159091